MGQEDKELLLKDLCARLLYGVKLITPYNDAILVGIVNRKGVRKDINYIDVVTDKQIYPIQYIRPYLRPMSSMTEEELKELNDNYGSFAYFFIQEPPYYHGLQVQHSDIGSIIIREFSEIYDWLNAHHFDYRGLIEKGLALEAPKDMYKEE